MCCKKVFGVVFQLKTLLGVKITQKSTLPGLIFRQLPGSDRTSKVIVSFLASDWLKNFYHLLAKNVWHLAKVNKSFWVSTPFGQPAPM